MGRFKWIIQSFRIYRNPLRYLYAKISRDRNEVGLVRLRNGAILKIHMGNSDINSVSEIFGTRAYATFLSRIRPGDTFVDIGANIGIVSVAAGLRGAQVISLEPNPYLIDLLKENLSLNHIVARICEEGIARDSGKRTLYFEPTMWGGASLYKTKTDGEMIEVEIDCLGINDFLDNFDIVDFLKIDIEGGEKEVLDAASHANLKKVRNICVECHVPFASAELVSQRLKKNGFQTTVSEEPYAVVGRKEL